MLIDWFTVGAQTLNFLILVWLLKHFLYKPILDAIDAREKRIVAELADADARKAEALSEREAFLKKNEQFDHNHAAMMSKVTDEACRVSRLTPFSFSPYFLSPTTGQPLIAMCTRI